jgi:hypothetical protein
MMNSTFHSLNRRRFIRGSVALGLLAGLRGTAACETIFEKKD